jgi:hypothetical protein
MVRGGMGKMLVGSRVDERKEKYESGSKGMNNNRLVDTKAWCRVVTLIENEILSVGNHRVRRVYEYVRIKIPRVKAVNP